MMESWSPSFLASLFCFASEVEPLSDTLRCALVPRTRERSERRIYPAALWPIISICRMNPAFSEHSFRRRWHKPAIRDCQMSPSELSESTDEFVFETSADEKVDVPAASEM